MITPFKLSGLALAALLSSAAIHADEDVSDPVVVQASDWNLMIDEMPEQEIEAAKTSFIAREWDKAAMHIQRAASFTRIEASRASSAGKDMLQKSAKDLSDLGERVISGSVSTVTELDKDFSEAQESLAVHYHELASRAHEAGDDISAGNYLAKAADSLHAAVTWSGMKATETTDLVVQESRHAGVVLKSGADWSLSKAEEWSLKLHDSIVEFGKRL